MKIGVFVGSGQHDIFRKRFDWMTGGFEKLGHDVTHFDLTRDPAPSEVHDRLTGLSPDFTVGINGIYPTFPDHPPTYDNGKQSIPHFAFLVDHPVHQLNRFENPLADNLYLSCQDRSQIDYLRYVGKSTDNVMFLPNAVPEDQIGEANQVDSWSRKFLFPGTLPDPTPLRERIKQEFTDTMQSVVNECLNELMKRPTTPVLEGVVSVLERSESSDSLDREIVEPVVIVVERLFRSLSREMNLSALSEHDCHIVGKVSGENQSIREQYEDRLFDPVDRRELFEMMRDSFGIINLCQVLPDGSHPRVLDALSLGLPVLSTYSDYLSEEFGEENGVFLFKTGRAERIHSQVRKMINNPEVVRNAATSGQQRIRANHTWKQRASQIVTFLNETQAIA